MLSDIYEKLNIDAEIDHKFIKEAIASDNLWGIGWKYEWIFQQYNETPDIVREVVDILDMWSFIEDGYNNLSAKEQTLVQSNNRSIKFIGFDGNNEPEYHIARFIISKLNRFSVFSGRNLDSHCPCVGGYKKMLKIFTPIRETLDGTKLDANQIIEILNARKHI